MWFLNTWNRSIEELRNVRTLSAVGILLALSVVLKFAASITIGPFIRIGFSDLPGIVASFLFGPAVGCIFWSTSDIIRYIVVPDGPFFPGFTISAFLNGVIFGFIFYQKPVSVYRVLCAWAVSKLLVSLCLNTYWLSLLYGSAFTSILPARILTNVVMLFVDAAISFIVLRFVDKLWKLTMQSVY